MRNESFGNKTDFTFVFSTGWLSSEKINGTRTRILRALHFIIYSDAHYTVSTRQVFV